MFDRTLYPDYVEGPLGTPMLESVAKAFEKLMKEFASTRDEAMVKFASSGETSIIEGERADISKITTEAVDRDKEVIRAKGIDLSPYRLNPVVLLNHEWKTLPVGRAQWIKDDSAGNPGLVAKTIYAKRPADLGENVEWVPSSVYSLVKEGMLPGKSIGFLPLDSRPPTKEEIASRPELKSAKRVITQSVLLEYSVVGIPSNPEALVQMKSFPALASLMGHFEHVIKEESGITLEQVMASIQSIEARLKAIDELKEDQEVVKLALRSIRKDLVRQPQPKSGNITGSLARAVESELAKLLQAS